MNRYVCAFRGRRDDYQVPLALDENKMLDQLITDFYETKSLKKAKKFLPPSWHSKLVFRSKEGIAVEHIKCLWKTTLLEQSRHMFGFSKAQTFAVLDQDFSREAARRAQKMKSNLLLYSPYAWEAFTKKYSHTPHKVLFQYHPHAEWERQLLTADLDRFPAVKHSYKEETGEHLAPYLHTRINDCWQHADLILCASSFTRKTLIEAGADAKICKVIPYGIDLPTAPNVQIQSGFRVLFVGSGIQRKGLHHLLYAWQRARLSKDSLLILVCRTLDPGIETMIRETKQVLLLRDVDTNRLRELYMTSSLFVMPSLVEGFGQVFLEALSYGCPVLGTEHTCLPDLGNSEDGIFMVGVGNIEQLTDQLEILAGQLREKPELHQAAHACAARYSWQQFRSSLVQLL